MSGFPVNIRTFNNYTPLHLAASAGKIEVMALLISNGALLDGGMDDYINEDDDELVKIENVNDVPLSFEFTQVKDNDPSKLEGFLMEDVHIPLNLRFVHLATEEGDVMIRK